MGAYVVGHITVKDEEGFNSYAEQGLAIVASVGGEVAASGQLVKVLTGEHDRQMFVLLKFPESGGGGEMVLLGRLPGPDPRPQRGGGHHVHLL